MQQALVLDARTLTAPGEPEKRHLEIRLPTGSDYVSGDYLALLPMNPHDSVRRVMSRFSLPWDAVIKVNSNDQTIIPPGIPLSAYDVLRGYVEISQPATKKV